MGGLDVTERLGILPETGELRQQLMAFEFNHHGRRFATPDNYHPFAVFNIIE
jgi:hypothetical protein